MLGTAIGRLARRIGNRQMAEAAAGAGGGRVGSRPGGQVEEGPRSAYEMVTRRALNDLTRDFERLEVKVNGLLFGVALTFVLEVWKSFR